MAKITIAGDAMVVTSDMTFEDVSTINKYRPEALTLMGGEDNKEPMFSIGINEDGKGGINRYGVTFTRASRDDDKKAQVTVCLVDATIDVKSWIADTFGTALANLNKLEESLPDVLKEIKADRDKIMSSIEIAQ